MIVRLYYWKNLTTSMLGTANFTAYDAHEAGCDFHNGIPDRCAFILIDKWNNPANWKHSLGYKESHSGYQDLPELA